MSGKPSGVTDKTWKRLAPKGQRFVEGYLDHGNALKAYEDAGYVKDQDNGDGLKHRRNAYSVMRGIKVRQALVEHKEHRAVLDQAKKDYALDWIVSEHERLMEVAEEKGDLAVATQNLIAIGRTRGVYADTVRLDVAAQREYTETERLDAARLTRILLEDREAEVVEVEVEDGAGENSPLSRPNSMNQQNQGESQGTKPETASNGPETVPARWTPGSAVTPESEGLPLTPAVAEAKNEAKESGHEG